MFGDKFFSDKTPAGVSGESSWNMLDSLEQLEELDRESSKQTVLIFKHSTRCGVSRSVLKQFEHDFKPSPEVKPYYLDLLVHRNISNAIAERYHVVHQSPQLIVIKEGKAISHASHEAISDLNLG